MISKEVEAAKEALVDMMRQSIPEDFASASSTPCTSPTAHASDGGLPEAVEPESVAAEVPQAVALEIESRLHE